MVVVEEVGVEEVGAVVVEVGVAEEVGVGAVGGGGAVVRMTEA